MKRLLLLLLMCGLFVACEEEASIDPKPATPENAEAFVSELKPGYTAREILQVPLGEDYQGDRSWDHFEADGVVIGSLVDGPGTPPRGITTLFYKGPDGRTTWLMSLQSIVHPRPRGADVSQFKNSRALARFLMEQRR